MYTVKTPYEKEIKFLEEGLIKFSVEYHFYPIKSTGNWQKNTQQKANVLLQSMNDFPEYDVVWLDADALLLQKPVFFETVDCDFCASLRPHREHKRHRLLSGTMFMKNNDKMKSVIKQWIELNKTNRLWDQENLYNIIEKNKRNLKIENLPGTYVKMLPSRIPENNINPNGVVWHKQRSRKIRENKWKI